MNDAIQAVEKAWIQSLSVANPTDPVGKSPRIYLYEDSVFYIQPQARLNWKMYQFVTFGIMVVLRDRLHNGTNFIILGANYEGNLGRGNVHNVA